MRDWGADGTGTGEVAMGWNPGAWGTKAWAAVGAVVGGLAGAALAGGFAGAFTPTGPGVGGGSYPHVLYKAECNNAGADPIQVELFTVPAGSVFVPDKVASTVRVWAAPIDLTLAAKANSFYQVGIGEVTANGDVWLGGPLAAGTKVAFKCIPQANKFNVYISGQLQRN